MFQVLNSIALLSFCASAGVTGRRVLHVLLIAVALSLDCLIAVLLNAQRAVIGRAATEMALPIKALHIGSAVLALLLMIVCLALAIRRWRGAVLIGPWGMAVLGFAITVRAVAYASSFLMTSL